MALRRIRLGEVMIPYKEKCGISDLTPNDISGVNREKEFFEPSRQVGSDTSDYQNVPPKYFACNLMHVGRDVVLPIAYNHTDKTKRVSPAYSVFKIKENSALLDYYFYIYLKSNERDRMFWFNTDSSIRDGMTWDDFCNIEIEIPDLPTQEKYVNVYLSMLENQKSYERGLEDLKLVCDVYIEDLRKKGPLFELSKHLTRRMEKNSDFSVQKLIGVGKEGFIEPKQSKDETNGHICYLVKKNDFVFAPPQLHQGSIDYYVGDEPLKCSDAYIVFYINDESELDPLYLMMMLKNPNIQHMIWFYRDGVREQFNFEQLSEIAIPIPKIETQRSLSAIFRCYLERKEINERLKTQIKDICPILIKGSIKEAKEA